MAPLPPIWDPSSAIDRLPKPYRILDKLIAEIIEQALTECEEREKQRQYELENKISMIFPPSNTLHSIDAVSCFCALAVSGYVLMANVRGELIVYNTKTDKEHFRKQILETSIVAVEVGPSYIPSIKIVASASKDILSIHELQPRTCSLKLMGQVTLPVDPDNSEAPSHLSFSMNACHIGVSYANGAVAVYELIVPSESSVDAPLCNLSLVVHLTSARVKALLLGNIRSGESQVVWQIQQRPSKVDRGDKNIKAARGVYIWWVQANRLLLCGLENLEAASLPQKSGSTWVLPHPITCATSTANGKLLAFGLHNGTVVIWDDHLGCHKMILPRLQSSISAVAFVNNNADLIMAAAQDGTLCVSDLQKPENSVIKPKQLVLPATYIHFPPWDPIGLCVCTAPSQFSQATPRVLLYNVEEMKLVGEFVPPVAAEGVTEGTAEPIPTGFGAAGVCQAAEGAVRDMAEADAHTGGGIGGGLDESQRQGSMMMAPIMEMPYPAWSFRGSQVLVGGRLHHMPVPPEEVAKDAPGAKGARARAEEAAAPKMSVASCVYHFKFDRALAVLQPDEGRMMTPEGGQKDGASPGRKKGGLKTTKKSGRRRDNNKKLHFSDSDDASTAPATVKKALPKDAGFGPTKDPFKGLQIKSGKMVETVAGLIVGQEDGSVLKVGEPEVPLERPKSPPWHHTNPTARIMPEMEEGAVLTRIMERVGNKGGGRKKRDRRMDGMTEEMMRKLGRETGVKPSLLVFLPKK